MSSLNVVPRKIHKERSQPSSRKKYGLLEKHKDYKKRAVDYHRKQDTLTALSEKAKMRNPDEFYTSMKRSQVVNGVHRKHRSNDHTFDQLRSMKTQDIA
jgi:U3 small nucleolar RNA-associated protein 11